MINFKEIIAVIIPIKREVLSTLMKPKEIEKNFELRLDVLRWSKYVGGNSFKVQFEDSRSTSPKFIVSGSIHGPQNVLGINERKVSYLIFPSWTRLFVLFLFEGQFFYLGLLAPAFNSKVIFFSIFFLIYIAINRIYTKEFEGIKHTMSQVLKKGSCNHLYKNQFKMDKDSSYEKYNCVDCGLRISSFDYKELSN